MTIAAAIIAHLLLLAALVLIWQVERDALFAVLSKQPPPADLTTRTLVPIWWLSLTLMLNSTAGLPGIIGLVLTSLVAVIVLLASARTLAQANNRNTEMLARPAPARRLLLLALSMLSFGAVIVLFDAAHDYSAERHAAPEAARLPIE